VSVVIPVRNGAGFVAEAIASALGQTGNEARVTQVVVVDNNSTDETRAVVENFMATRGDGRVTLLSETRPNAANARNAGARAATGDWLAFLDADDLWLPEKLERQMQTRDRHPEAQLLFTLGVEFLGREAAENESGVLAVRPEPYAMLTPSSLLLRREVFAQVGELPDVPSGEFIAWYGWARELGYRELVVPEVLVKRRIHDGNSTRVGGAMAAYPAAMKWLLDRRRQRATRLGVKAAS
jgi:glycosyltransferase involved in cell wall biosynthesis